ncbi:hypothetical protein [Dysgonomonas sp. Marseille-Q5470]|uniref:hypothetical protein n=1 Tax=Dysgonomonas sp. Marseille-Q5470 TaxID=3039494 RepID=UPI0032DFA124
MKKRNTNLKEAKGDMYSFVSHTWNPIKGKCEHGCAYCYMNRLGEKAKPVRLDEKLLNDDLGTSNFIFVVTGTDMFASNIPSEWITKTLDYCDKFDNKYLFQSKNPRRFLEFIEHPVFKKSVICTTIESNRDYPEVMNNAPKIEERVSAMEEIGAKGFETYVTIEPIMDFDQEELVELIKRCKPTQVNIGARTGRKIEIPEPTRKQIVNLIKELEKFTTVEEKKNLARLTNMERIMEKELTQIKQQQVTSSEMKVQIMRETEDGSYIPNKSRRRFALIKENRPIQEKNVCYFLQKIHAGNYNKILPIITIEAMKLVDKCNIVDFEGNSIEKDNASDYLVILDGQHRIKAFSMVNATYKGTDREIVIPNVHIEDEIENVREYLVNINTAGHDWSKADKACVSAINSQNKCVQKTDELIRKGFNASAATHLCMGKRLSPSEQKELLISGNVNFITSEDEDKLTQRADGYYTIGMCIKDMNIKVLTKRYYVIGFIHFAESRTDAEALTALGKLSIDDFRETKDEGLFMNRLRDALIA